MIKIVKVPKATSLVVCGDIHEHEAQFEKLLEKIKPSTRTWFASVGDIYDKGFGIDAAERMVDKLKELSEKKIGFVIRGNHELKHIRRAKRNGKALSPQLKWMNEQPTAIMFEFSNRSRVLMVHGGVTPHTTIDDLANDIESCYVRWVDEDGKHVRLKKQVVDGEMKFAPTRPGVVWHEKYNGRFGYIVSGHLQQEDGRAKFYNYSCNLDSACFNTGKLTAQEFTDKGTRGELIVIDGPARWPETKSLYKAMAK